MCRRAPHLPRGPSQECALFGRGSTPHAVQLWMSHRVGEARSANPASSTELYCLRGVLTWGREEEVGRKPSARRKRVPRTPRARPHHRPGGSAEAALLDLLNRRDSRAVLIRVFAPGAVRPLDRRVSPIEPVAPILSASKTFPLRLRPRRTTDTRRRFSGRANWVRMGRSPDDFTTASKHLHAESGCSYRGPGWQAAHISPPSRMLTRTRIESNDPRGPPRPLGRGLASSREA
jgi:hypothetical protein